MLTVIEYARKDYGILFKVSTFYTKSKQMGRQSPFSTNLQQNDIFSKRIYF